MVAIIGKTFRFHVQTEREALRDAAASGRQVAASYFVTPMQYII